MEAQSRSRSRSRILGCSSMFRFFRSLVGRKGRSKNSDKAQAGSRPGSSQEPKASSRIGRFGGRKRKRQPPATQLWALSVDSSHLPLWDAFGLGTGDVGAPSFTPTEIQRLRAQGIEVSSVSPRGNREVLDHLPEKKKGEKEVPTGEASGDAGASDRDHCAQDPAVEQGCFSLVEGPLVPSPNACSREEDEEREYLVGGELTPSKVGSTPWNYLLSLYKHLQKSAMAKRGACPQLPTKEGSAHEEKEEEGDPKEEHSEFKACIPRIIAQHSPLHTTFRSTDTVGFMQSKLKKILEVQRESRLWKVDSLEDRKLLTQPEITLEEAGIVDGQHLLLEETDEMGNWPPE
uniref:Gametogenetin-binding protein 1 n=1 Tax=Jaculus jaculus TaxID=51337 RepID=A0A8C5L8F5_JACJA